MKVIGAILAILGAAIIAGAGARAQDAAAPPTEHYDVIVTVDPCKKRLRPDCMTARQISRYGVQHYWEVVYADLGDHWVLAEESDYGAKLDDSCGKEVLAYLRNVAPIHERRLSEVLGDAQDIKERCELARIQADGLDVVDKALNIQANDIGAFRIFRHRKAELASAPPQAQAMLAPYLGQQQP